MWCTRAILKSSNFWACPFSAFYINTSITQHQKFRPPCLHKATAAARAVQWHPFLPVCAVFPSVQTRIRLPMFAMFGMRTAVEACECTQWESLHWKLTEAVESLAAPGNQTHISIVPVFSVCCCTNWAVYWSLSGLSWYWFSMSVVSVLHQV